MKSFLLKINAKQFLVGLTLVLVGILLGWYLSESEILPKQLIGFQANCFRAGQLKYTNPLLECDQEHAIFKELVPFQDSVTANVSSIEKDPAINDVSMYFRDLNNGLWFGIGQDATYAPASLLKVPLAIAYYKLGESDSSVLKKEISFNGPEPAWPKITQTILPEKTLQTGQSYSVEELIERMVDYSDNQAYYLLYENIDQNSLQQIYKDFNLGLNGPGTKDDSIVTVKSYSSFFRILFNASYLTQKDSEELLGYLAKSEFSDGLVAGVPSGVSVSHKFSERESSSSSATYLSDCGIVYYPKHPYLLCVMTKGTDLSTQAGAIKQVSSSVYNEVNGQFGSGQ